MKVKFNTAVVLAVATVIALASCKRDGNNGNEGKGGAKANGEAIVLKIEEAQLLEVEDKPQYNTAEWVFKVDKPGRWDVWLSSLTLDTLQLHFEGDVIITAGDTKIVKKPVRDRVVTEDKSITMPWYRADSHMGSVFFSKPGEYQVQVISDRVEPHSSDLSQLGIDKQTLINSLIMKPKVN